MKKTNQNQFMKTTTYAKKKCIFCGEELTKFTTNNAYPFGTKANNNCCDRCNIIYCLPMRYIINQLFTETDNKNRALVLYDNPLQSKSKTEYKEYSKSYEEFSKKEFSSTKKSYEYGVIINKKRRYHYSDYEYIYNFKGTKSSIKKLLDCEKFSIIPITFSLSLNEKYVLIIDTSDKVTIPNNKTNSSIPTKRVNYLWNLLNLSTETSLKHIIGNILIMPISNLK